MHGTDMIIASAWVLDYTMDSRKERVPFSGLLHAEKESSRNSGKVEYEKGKCKRGQPFLLPLLSQSLVLNTKAIHASLAV